MIIKNLSKGDSGSKIVLAVNHHLTTPPPSLFSAHAEVLGRATFIRNQAYHTLWISCRSMGYCQALTASDWVNGHLHMC